MESNQNQYLGTAPISHLLLKFSLPSVTSMLVSSLYNMVDHIFIGQGIGYIANAFALLIGNGCAAFQSICLGKGDNHKVKQTIGNSIVLTIVTSLLLVVLFTLFQNNFLWLFGGTEQNFEYAKQYLQIILIGFPFFMFTNTLSSIINANGSPGYTMLCGISGCVINLILDPIANFIFNMGVQGAALATITGQIVTALISLRYIRKHILLSKEDFILSKNTFYKALPLGMSSFFTQVCILIINAVMNNALVTYGASSKFGPDIPLAVVGIVMKVYSLVISFVVGIAAGAQPVVGYNYGLKAYDRVRQLYKTIMAYEIAVGIVAFVIFEVFPMNVIQLFGSEGELYNEFALFAFRVYFSTVVFCCVQKATFIFLQGIGKPLASMSLSILRDFVFAVSSVYIMAYFLGIYGPLYSAPISDLLSMIPLIYMAHYILNKATRRNVQ